MKTGDEVSARVKPWFDRFSDSLKVVGSGNTAGLIAMVAAIYTVREEHVHTVLLLKPTAIIFAIGILLFGLAYLVFTYAWIFAEHYAGLIDPAADDLSKEALAARAASEMHMKRSVYFAVGATFCFFLGFIVATVALIRY
jgi:hypothetical protein